jgi:hypothetical protein
MYKQCTLLTLIVYMKKFLNSDWLRVRAVQLFRNTVQKKNYSANFLIFLKFLNVTYQAREIQCMQIF